MKKEYTKEELNKAVSDKKAEIIKTRREQLRREFSNHTQYSRNDLERTLVNASLVNAAAQSEINMLKRREIKQQRINKILVLVSLGILLFSVVIALV